MATRTKKPKEEKPANGEQPKRRGRPKQGYLPDMEPPSIPAINEAAALYVERRDARMAMLKREIEAQDNLLALMHEHKLKTYSFDSYDVALDLAEKVKVKRKKENGDTEE